jgi:tetratricopeptide (TPR) repeat protein
MPLPNGAYVGRIRIESLLGAGGMGEVYRGWDERLERPVALKSIHPDKRLSPALRARFLREARVLSKLDHPNICRIWDVLELADGDWLVLELIDGITLHEQIERGIDRAEALRIALQVARVLRLAHGRGIIHRDLKPDNVMLTAAGEVKVLDFGLARAVDAEYGDPAEREAAINDFETTLILGGDTTLPDESRTSVGALVGTLHYMSPEQARGLPLTPASDIYSLGIILHELLSGGLSAYGDSESTADLLMRVRGANIVPRDFHDRELQRLIARMTGLHPLDRAQLAEVTATLERIAGRPERTRRRLFAGALAAAVVAAIGIGTFAMRQFGGTPGVARRGSRLAVLPFRNATGNKSMQWIELGLMDDVARELSATRGVATVKSEEVLQAMRHMQIANAFDLDPKSRARLLDALGADVAIASTVTSEGGRYTIRYKTSDRTRSEAPAEATAAQITDAAKQMTERIIDRVDPAARIDARTRGTADDFAAVAFAMGRQAELTRGPKASLGYFIVALDRDPGFLAAKERLADNYEKVSRFAEAQPLMDEVLRDATKRNDQPALATAHMLLASWMYRRGDYPTQLREAGQSLAIARRLGDLSAAAKAQNWVALALWRMNRMGEAKRSLTEAMALARQAHSPQDEARVLNNLGMFTIRLGDRAAARKLLDQAMVLADATGDLQLSVSIVNNLGLLYGDAGDLVTAEAMSRRELAITREAGDRNTETMALVNLGLWLYGQGKEAEAIAATEQARALAEQAGTRQITSLLLSNLAQAKARLGDLAAAQRDADAAMAIERQLHDADIGADVRVGAAYCAIRGGRLAEAQRLLDEADKVRSTLRGEVFRARLAYARAEYAKAAAIIDKAKTMGDTWLIQYETMRKAFGESAKTGKESTIKFEEPIR